MFYGFLQVVSVLGIDHFHLPLGLYMLVFFKSGKDLSLASGADGSGGDRVGRLRRSSGFQRRLSVSGHQLFGVDDSVAQSGHFIVSNIESELRLPFTYIDVILVYLGLF